ncbi:MAG: histidinol-phosphatase HisJ family protein [Eubacterium sp.]|nr:histidinol-phosphatase HisJ family protein [Eubacterium sp.]
MKYRNIIDMHTHSDNSFDGHHSCILLCEGALDNGGRGLAITDHCDIDGKNYDFRAFVLNQYTQSFAAKKAFEGRLLVMQGLELGQGIYEKEKSLDIINSFDYDIILGSIHNLKDTPDFYYLNYDENDVDDLLRRYFEAVLELCEWNETDSLAHLTYPLRYIVGRAKKSVDLSRYSELTDAIFESLIKNKKALEVNVSELDRAYGLPMPEKSLIKRYKELGGEYITVGSDSHYYSKICLNIDRGYDLIKECGFEHFTIFKNREPMNITIE